MRVLENFEYHNSPENSEDPLSITNHRPLPAIQVDAHGGEKFLSVEMIFQGHGGD
jgi:hypothetical protein